MESDDSKSGAHAHLRRSQLTTQLWYSRKQNNIAITTITTETNFLGLHTTLPEQTEDDCVFHARGSGRDAAKPHLSWGLKRLQFLL